MLVGRPGRGRARSQLRPGRRLARARDRRERRSGHGGWRSWGARDGQPADEVPAGHRRGQPGGRQRALAGRRRQRCRSGDRSDRLAGRAEPVPAGPARAGQAHRHGDRGEPAQGRVLGGRRPPGVVPVTPPVSAWPDGTGPAAARIRRGRIGRGGQQARSGRTGAPGPSGTAPAGRRAAQEVAGGRPRPARRGRRRRGQDGPARAGPARGDRPGVAEASRSGLAACRGRAGRPGGRCRGSRSGLVACRGRAGQPGGRCRGSRSGLVACRGRAGQPGGRCRGSRSGRVACRGGPGGRAAGAEDRVRDGEPAGAGRDTARRVPRIAFGTGSWQRGSGLARPGGQGRDSGRCRGSHQVPGWLERLWPGAAPG